MCGMIYLTFNFAVIYEAHEEMEAFGASESWKYFVLKTILICCLMNVLQIRMMLWRLEFIIAI